MLLRPINRYILSHSEDITALFSVYVKSGNYLNVPTE